MVSFKLIIHIKYVKSHEYINAGYKTPNKTTLLFVNSQSDVFLLLVVFTCYSFIIIVVSNVISFMCSFVNFYLVASRILNV